MSHGRKLDGQGKLFYPGWDMSIDDFLQYFEDRFKAQHPELFTGGCPNRPDLEEPDFKIVPNNLLTKEKLRTTIISISGHFTAEQAFKAIHDIYYDRLTNPTTRFIALDSSLKTTDVLKAYRSREKILKTIHKAEQMQTLVAQRNQQEAQLREDHRQHEATREHAQDARHEYETQQYPQHHQQQLQEQHSQQLQDQFHKQQPEPQQLHSVWQQPQTQFENQSQQPYQQPSQQSFRTDFQLVPERQFQQPVLGQVPRNPVAPTTKSFENLSLTTHAPGVLQVPATRENATPFMVFGPINNGWVVAGERIPEGSNSPAASELGLHKSLAQGSIVPTGSQQQASGKRHFDSLYDVSDDERPAASPAAQSAQSTAGRAPRHQPDLRASRQSSVDSSAPFSASSIMAVQFPGAILPPNED